MITNRFSKITVVFIVVAIALLTVSFVASPKATQSYPDYAQRHWAELGTVDTTDYALRHLELQPVAWHADLTDYYFRLSAQ